VAGWDESEGGAVYEIPLGGACVKQPFAIGKKCEAITLITFWSATSIPVSSIFSQVAVAAATFMDLSTVHSDRE
jgi:hypothetical protein